MRKMAVLPAVLAAALVAGAAPAADQADKKDPKDSKSVVIEADGGRVKITASAEAKAGGQPNTITARRVEIHTAGGDEAATVTAHGPGDGWMGIHVSPVPGAVAAQLDVGKKGVMVRNVVKGSPADKAGLVRYDVIVAVDKGKPVENVETFVARVRSQKPGRKVALTVIRKAARKQLALTLGKPMADPEYVYEDEADEEWRDQLKLHSGAFRLRRTPDGMVIEGPQGKIDLPKAIFKVLPKGAWSDVHVDTFSGGGGKKSFKISRRVDGQAIEVESTKDGGILVRKATTDDRGSKRTTMQYKSAKELKEADPEAYELYKGVHVSREGIGARQFRIHRPRPPDAARKHAQETVVEIERQLKDMAQQARDRARHARMRLAKAVAPSAPEREFDVEEDGRITVKVREGGTAAKLTFKNADEMKEKAPKLYKHYEKLLKDQP